MEVMLYNWSIKKWVLLPMDEKDYPIEEPDIYYYCKECEL